jgi:hypothetical protein
MERTDVIITPFDRWKTEAEKLRVTNKEAVELELRTMAVDLTFCGVLIFLYTLLSLPSLDLPQWAGKGEARAVGETSYWAWLGRDSTGLYLGRHLSFLA